MSLSKDPNKVAAKYARTIKAAPGFTTDKKGDPKGFYFDATLTDIEFGTTQGQPSVTCKLNGVIAT